MRCYQSKKTKKKPLSKEDKKKNRQLCSERALNENVIGMIKRFKIISDRYRNRRKRFGLRFNLLAVIYNFELYLGYARGPLFITSLSRGYIINTVSIYPVLCIILLPLLTR